MAGKQAKILSVGDVNDLLVFASCTRHPLRNRVIVLLAAKAGLRAGEIVKLTWDMVLDPTGAVGSVIELHDHAAKNGSGRSSRLTPTFAKPSPPVAGFQPAADRHSIRARRSDDALEHRGLVQSRISQHWSARLLVPFRTPDVHHPGGAASSSGRRLAA